MTDAEQITALKRELAETRTAAVKLLVGMTLGITSSAEGRLEIAEGLESAAAGHLTPIAHISRLAADAIRARIKDGSTDA